MEHHIPAIHREVREFEARTELEAVAEDDREAARRALLQDHHDAQIKRLESEKDELIKKNAEVQRQLRVNRSRVTKAIENQNRKMMLMIALMVVYLFGTNPTAQQLIALIFQALTKGVIK